MEQKIYDIIKKYSVGNEAEDISKLNLLEDLHVTSMDMLNIIWEIEDELGVSFNLGNFSAIVTAEDFARETLKLKNG